MSVKPLRHVFGFPRVHHRPTILCASSASRRSLRFNRTGALLCGVGLTTRKSRDFTTPWFASIIGVDMLSTKSNPFHARRVGKSVGFRSERIRGTSAGQVTPGLPIRTATAQGMSYDFCVGHCLVTTHSYRLLVARFRACPVWPPREFKIRIC